MELKTLRRKDLRRPSASSTDSLFGHKSPRSGTRPQMFRVKDESRVSPYSEERGEGVGWGGSYSGEPIPKVSPVSSS